MVSTMHRPPTRSAPRLPALLALTLAAGSLLPVTAAGAQTPQPAQVTFVHGVRGLVADVQVDGKVVLRGFAPERVTDVLSLPAGPHRVQVRRAGSAAGAAPLIDTTVTLPAGARTTVGVGLGPGGAPRLRAFDDRRLAASGTTALVARSLAGDAPSAQVVVDGRAAGQLRDAGESVVRVQPGARAVEVRGGGQALVPSQDVPVAAGRTIALYLIDTPGSGGFGLVAQTLQPAGRAVPTVVDTGVGPVPARSSTPPLLAGLAALLLLAAPAVRRRAGR